MDIREPVTQDPPTADELEFVSALHCGDLDGMRLLAFRAGWYAATYTILKGSEQ